MTTVPEAIAEIRRILKGIDQEDYYADGWWETSTGAQLGATKLVEIEAFVASLIVQVEEGAQPEWGG